MKTVMKSILVASSLMLSAGVANAEVVSLDQLLQQVKQDRISERKISKKREAAFIADTADKKALLKKAKAQLAAEQKRGKMLQSDFVGNESKLAAKEVELENAKGTLGEMFGVVRAASSEGVGKISTSIVSAQHPGRTVLLEKLSEAKELPTLKELEELWIALQTEMTESGKVVKFTTEVVQLDGGSSQEEVIRIGTFNLIKGSDYLSYSAENGIVKPLGRQPEGFVTGAAGSFASTASGIAPLYIDPSRGQILSLLTAKATLEERFHQGGTVGYIITAVLALGFLIAIYKMLTLMVAGIKIRTQLKDTSNPKSGNALGRILAVYHENKGETDTENLELKLDEAIMRETPRIESGIGIIKILAAIAPLLGLLGTVTGMIGTFQSITLFGTGDPKIMAGDISMALVTTAMGLIAALPLILTHAVVAGRSKSIIHVLDEQAAGIVAAHAEKEQA